MRAPNLQFSYDKLATPVSCSGERRRQFVTRHAALPFVKCGTVEELTSAVHFATTNGASVLAGTKTFLVANRMAFLADGLRVE
jgi:hypothetical protein